MQELRRASCDGVPTPARGGHARQDSFYRGLTPEEQLNVTEYNFDHPNAMDQEAIMQCLVDLKARKPVEVPIYDFKTHRRARRCVPLSRRRRLRVAPRPAAHVRAPRLARSRLAETQRVMPADVIIFEGILVRPHAMPCRCMLAHTVHPG